MRKQISIALFLVLAALLLIGCQEGTIIYDGQEMGVTEAEERIADKLEVENPDLDLEISIFEESDD